MGTIRSRFALRTAVRALLCILVLLICPLSACDGSVVPEMSPGVEPSVFAEPSPSPTPTPTPTPKPTPTPDNLSTGEPGLKEPKVELMSYDEYFAEEREIEAPPFGIDDSPFNVADDDWHKIVRTSDGYVVAENTYGGCAVVVDGDGYYREVAFAKDNKLYITKDNGETPVVVYEATEKLYLAFGDNSPSNGILIWFIDGTRRYRLYVPTCTVDFMFDLPDVLNEEEMTALWRTGQLPDDAIYVWHESPDGNLKWHVQLSCESTKWASVLAEYEGITTEEFINTNGASWRVSVCYNSQRNEWELTPKAEFVFSQLEDWQKMKGALK